MYKFENYTLIVETSPEEYAVEVPEHKFLAYLREIPEATLHEYGTDRTGAIQNLKEQFDWLQTDFEKQGISFPKSTRTVTT